MKTKWVWMLLGGAALYYLLRSERMFSGLGQTEPDTYPGDQPRPSPVPAPEAPSFYPGAVVGVGPSGPTLVSSGGYGAGYAAAPTPYPAATIQPSVWGGGGYPATGGADNRFLRQTSGPALKQAPLKAQIIGPKFTRVTRKAPMDASKIRIASGVPMKASRFIEPAGPYDVGTRKWQEAFNPVKWNRFSTEYERIRLRDPGMSVKEARLKAWDTVGGTTGNPPLHPTVIPTSEGLITLPLKYTYETTSGPVTRWVPGEI